MGGAMLADLAGAIRVGATGAWCFLRRNELLDASIGDRLVQPPAAAVA